MIVDVLLTIAKYQTLIAATFSVAATIVFAPLIGGQIAERYGRSREVWKRRLDFTSDMHRLNVALIHYVQDKPIYGSEKSNEFYRLCLDFYSRGRIIYSDPVEEDVLALILRLPILEESLASEVLSGVSRFLETGTRTPSSGAQILPLFRLLKLRADINDAVLNAYRADGDPGTKILYRQTHEIFKSLTNEITRLKRRYALPRPWMWYNAIEFEILRYQEKQRLLTAAKKDKQPNP